MTTKRKVRSVSKANDKSEGRSTHTPTPWELRGENIRGINLQGDSIAIAHVYEGAERHGDSRHGNASFIVRACNAHDELVAAAKYLLESVEFQECPDGRWSTADSENYNRRTKLEAAIAKAEGE